MKRKIRGLFFSIGIAGSLILGGCGKEEKEPVTITMIHAWGGTGEDHVAMRDIYDGFQKENPDIEVQLISMPGRKEMLRKVGHDHGGRYAGCDYLQRYGTEYNL